LNGGFVWARGVINRPKRRFPVHDGGLIGLDNACIHADNTFVDCMNYSLPVHERTNCSKTWHHSWVHDCREKGVRGDDYNLNLTMHHLVVYNLGDGEAGLGLGRIVCLYYRSSTLYHIH
jgi:hypothetical protein